MRVATKLAIVLLTSALCAKLSAKQTAVIIDLTEQMAYLLEDGRVACVSPIASGKEGCGTPVGSFRVIGKDLNHQSGSFGLISNADDGIVNPNATPGSSVPPGCHYVPAPMPYFMEFRKYVAMHAGYLPGYPGIARLCSDAQRPCCEILCQSANRYIGQSDRERQECETCQKSDSNHSARQFQVRRSRMSSKIVSKTHSESLKWVIPLCLSSGNLTAEMKSSGIKEVILTPVRDEEIDSIRASEKRIKIIGLAAFLALLFLAGALAIWAFF